MTISPLLKLPEDELRRRLETALNRLADARMAIIKRGSVWLEQNPDMAVLYVNLVRAEHEAVEEYIPF